MREKEPQEIGEGNALTEGGSEGLAPVCFVGGEGGVSGHSIDNPKKYMFLLS